MENNDFKILIFEDEVVQRESLARYLKKQNFQVSLAENGKAGLELFKKESFDLILTDFKMPEISGLEVVKTVKTLNPDTEAIVMTAYSTVENAVEVMKAGAYDYLIKPINLAELLNLIHNIQDKKVLISENRLLKQQLRDKFKFEMIVSAGRGMEEALNLAGRAANSKANVLVRGETGTGKELIARAIHYSGKRKNHPFVVVNCSALADNLLEDELFGHEKGAFTGADKVRIGRFEEADGGTVFLDELGDIALTTQVKLLRAIQFGEYSRIGSNRVLKSDVRIIAATHKNLENMISNQSFREDLYYRLNVITIQIPPLRERREEISLLTDHFIRRFAQENQKEITGISREAQDLLVKYNFPGNVRELENIIERAVVLCRSQVISLRDLPQLVPVLKSDCQLSTADFSGGFKAKVSAFEKELLTNALTESGGNQSQAARLLDISERHLRSSLLRLGMK